MKLIKFLQAYGRHKPGHVIGTKDSDADSLIAAGIAEEVADGIKPLKYAPGVAPRVECVTPIFEELEASPKGAVWSTEIETAEASEPIETADFKHKQKQLKK